MTNLRRVVLLSALLLFGLWVVWHFQRLTGDQEGVIRFVLGGLLALVILFRWKPRDQEPVSLPAGMVPAAAVAGLLGVVVGLVFRVHQVEWIGLLVVLYACFSWALPARYRTDVLLSLVLLYWIHPLPWFGSFQLAMQYLSIKGGEWLLHCLNVRVWADGFLLHTMTGTFGVPESCSGMRTIVTVLLCTLGTCILFRLKGHEVLVFLGLGVLQVLLLNIIRVTVMALLAPRMPAGWGETFLHDSAGIFLVVSILAVQGEASWWKVFSSRRRRRIEGIATGELERPERASPLPHVWRIILRSAAIALAAILVLGGIAGVIYKRRPTHRATMIRDLSEHLVHSDLETAEKGVMAALAFRPDDRDLKSLRARVLVLRGKNEEGLRAYNELPGELSPWEKILKSWTLMALDRPKEAVTLLGELPDRLKNVPSVAMVRAEYAALEKDIQGLAQHIVVAARSALTTRRVRRLLPYLAAYEQWETVVACHSDLPYASVREALTDIKAFLALDDLSGAGECLRMAIEQWPTEPRFLAPLFAMASGKQGGEWEGRFAACFDSNVDYLDPDQIANYMPFCFKLYRPDLAWRAFIRLSQLDPRDPALFLNIAEYAPRWLLFRSHTAHVVAASRLGTTDLTPVYLQTRRLPLFRDFWRRVPLIEKLTAGSMADIQRKSLRTALDELERRAKADSLTRRMMLSYAKALASVGRYDDARNRLADLEKLHPEMRRAVMLQNARIYDREGKSEQAYEMLTSYHASAKQTGLQADLLLVDAMMKINLGVPALAVIHEAYKRFPAAWRLRSIEAAVWDTFGFKEQALFMMGEAESPWQYTAVAQLLYDTGRYKTANEMVRNFALNIRRDPRKETQPVLVLPAEVALRKRWPDPLSREQMRQQARFAEEAAAKSRSPFLAGLARQTAQWLLAEGGGGTSAHDGWLALGRNRLEKAAALHRLAMALAQHRRYREAAAAVDRALEFIPTAVILRRMQVALTDGDPDVVEKAHAACPHDPEVWLAWLVVRLKKNRDDPGVAGNVRKALEERRFSPGATVRAGDLLLRAGRVDLACEAARDAMSRGRGFVPACTLALHCAVKRKDSDWALASAIRGVELAVDPTAFYKAVVAIKAARKEADADLTGALEYLRERLPREPRWTEYLASVYFDQKKPERALDILGPLMLRSAKNVQIETWLLASEAARTGGRPEAAVTYLEAAHRIYPDKLGVLNNLVYNLAQDPGTAARARELLPALLRLNDTSYAVLDTAAVVYLRNGDLHRAYDYSRKAVDAVKDEDYLASEVHLNAAEILLRLGRIEDAQKRLEEIRRTPGRPAHVDLAARELLRKTRDANRP